MSDAEENYVLPAEMMEVELDNGVTDTQPEFIQIKCEVDPDNITIEEPPLYMDDPLNYSHFMTTTEEPCSSQQVFSRPESTNQQSSEAMQDIQVCIKRASGAVTTTPMRIPMEGDIMANLISRIKTCDNPQMTNNVKIVVNDNETGTTQTFYYKSARAKPTYCEVEGCTWSTSDPDPDRVLIYLKQHLVKFHQNMSMCQYCTNLFATRLELTHHINKYHVTYVCSHCSIRFTTSKELCLHQLKYRNIPNINLTGSEGMSNPNVNLSASGITDIHSMNLPTSERTDIPDLSERNTETAQRKGINILRSNTRSTKQRRKAVNETYSCKVCPWVTFITDRKLALSELRSHMKEEHKNVGICVCLAAYPSKESLRRHITYCKKLFSCDQCLLTFTKSLELYIHYVKVHSYFCEKMGKSDKMPSRTCSNANCTWTYGSTKLKVDALSHMKLHSICEHGSAHICDICLVMFNNNQQFLIHFAQNHDKFRCKQCPRLEFESRWKLTVHSKQFHPETVEKKRQDTSALSGDNASNASTSSDDSSSNEDDEVVASTLIHEQSANDDDVVVASTSSQDNSTKEEGVVVASKSSNDEVEIIASMSTSRKVIGEVIDISDEEESTIVHSKPKVVKLKSSASLVQCQAEFCDWSTDGTCLSRAVYSLKCHTTSFHTGLHLCETCFSLFKTKKELLIHSVQAHVIRSCQYCRSKFTNEFELSVHQSKYHQNAKVGSRVTTRTRAAEISLNGIVKVANNEKPTDKLTWCTMTDCMWNTDVTETDEILTNIKCHASFVHNKNHVCEHCFCLFDKLCDRLNHIDEEHLKLCKICSFKYVTHDELNEHLIHAHLVPSNVSMKRGAIPVADDRNEHRLSSGTFMCKICFATQSDYEKFKTHCVECHSVPSDLNIDDIKDKNCLVVKRYKCNRCRFALTSLSKLRQHLMTSHKIGPSRIPGLDRGVHEFYACAFKKTCILVKWLRSKESLENHYRTYHELSDDKFPPTESYFVDPNKWYTTIFMEQQADYKYKSRYECQYCSDFFPTLEDINQHFKIKHDQYRCSKCLVMFNSQAEEDSHDQEVHTSKCMFCEFTSHRHQSMILHMTKSHSDVDPTSWNLQSTNPSHHLACKLCSQIFSTTMNAKMHYFCYHSKYACEFCWLSFNLSTQEDAHFKQNHLTECIHCRSKFQTQDELAFHVEREHPEDHGPLCESCGEYVINRETLLEHREDHGKPTTIVKRWETPQLCNICGITLANQKLLDHHMTSKHTENDQISGDFCKICNKQYKSIQMHMYRTHGAAAVKNMNRQMKFKCPHCPKRFSSVFDLKRHLPRHSKYTCNLCPMQFSYLPNLEEHVKELHTSIYAYSCGVCNKVFATNPDFQVHMKFHSPSSKDVFPKLLPYCRCDLCDQFRLSYDAIKKHIETDHIKGRKLVNVKRRKSKGRTPYLKRV